MSVTRGTRSLAAAGRRVRFMVFDFDGVMTDNRVWVMEDGREAVACWRSDGIGLSALRAAGVECFVLSTERNPVVGARCRKLKLAFEQGCDDKPEALRRLVADRGLTMAEVAYMGNDVNDLECLEMVGLPIIVQDAHPSVRRAATWRTKASGGRGAVREVCDALVAWRAPKAVGGRRGR